MIVIDGADDAIIGYSDNLEVVYDYHKLVGVFKDQGMTRDDAREWISFNILGGGVPQVIIMYPGDRELIDEVAQQAQEGE